MRLFVAVPVPEEMKMRLGILSDAIEQEGVVPVGADNMHITLRFIGESDRADEIEKKLKSISFERFDCELLGLGAFPSADYIKVVWTGIESGNALETLAKEVAGRLKGFGGDEKFSAHLTIARVKRKADLKNFLKKHEKEGFGRFTVTQFHLMKSELGPQGPRYTVLASFDAKG